MTRASGMGSRPKQWVISNGDLLGPSFAAHTQVPERTITSALEDEVLRPVVAVNRLIAHASQNDPERS